MKCIFYFFYSLNIHSQYLHCIFYIPKILLQLLACAAIGLALSTLKKLIDKLTLSNNAGCRSLTLPARVRACGILWLPKLTSTLPVPVRHETPAHTHSLPAFTIFSRKRVAATFFYLFPFFFNALCGCGCHLWLSLVVVSARIQI